MEVENINPSVYSKAKQRAHKAADDDENLEDPFDNREIFGKLLIILEVIGVLKNYIFKTSSET